MPRHYKTKSKRIVHRRRNGRFRQSTLADIGLAVCQNNECRRLFAPNYDALREKGNGMIDPFEFRKASKFCSNCGGDGENTNMSVAQPKNEEQEAKD